MIALEPILHQDHPGYASQVASLLCCRGGTGGPAECLEVHADEATRMSQQVAFELKRFFVAKSFRRHGVGSALFHHALEQVLPAAACVCLHLASSCSHRGVPPLC